jgi:predicted DNA-binding antitoxin AbrB/MazE fold protein
VSNYTVSLANGKSATVKVKVSYGKSSKTYTFTVTRAKSTNNNLATLSAPGAVFDSPFNPADTSYTLTLAETTKSVKISATAAAGKLAKVSPASKTVSLSNGGKTTVKISVKSQAGKTKTYVITVKRAPSTNNNLSYLKTSSKSLPLSPIFSAAATNYTITLPVDKSTVTISAKASGYKAGVKIDGKSASSKKITLKAGTSQTVRVVVKAQSGTEKVYTITVNRLISSDANLKSLKTSSKTAPLSPVFNPGVTSYTVNMPAKTSSVTLSASANGYGAKVTIDGKSASSKKITLKAGGEVTVRIVVTAQNGNTKEYVITVKRPLA